MKARERQLLSESLWAMLEAAADHEDDCSDVLAFLLLAGSRRLEQLGGRKTEDSLDLIVRMAREGARQMRHEAVLEKLEEC
jgi:hypothetical protein